jgi:hypothetical protein
MAEVAAAAAVVFSGCNRNWMAEGGQFRAPALPRCGTDVTGHMRDCDCCDFRVPLRDVTVALTCIQSDLVSQPVFLTLP